MALREPSETRPAFALRVPDGRWWLHHSAWVAAGLLLVVTAAAWIGVLRDVPSMSSTGAMDDATTDDHIADMAGMGTTLGLADATAYVGAWGVMMAAMMLPSAIPMIALYSTVTPAMAARRGRRAVPTTVFGGIYLLLWAASGVVAYAASVAVSAVADANDGLREISPYAIAAVAIAAGGYQFSAAKRVCLRQCRGPLSFLAERWSPGLRGAVRIGLAHAGYCLGCCWALMVVLVAAGAMGLAWVLLIAVAVLVEKVLPYGEWAARVIGAALILLGLLVAIQPDIAATLR